MTSDFYINTRIDTESTHGTKKHELLRPKITGITNNKDLDRFQKRKIKIQSLKSKLLLEEARNFQAPSKTIIGSSLTDHIDLVFSLFQRCIVACLIIVANLKELIGL